MKNKDTFLIGLAVVLAAVYVLFFTDWTKKKDIQISYTNLRVSPNGDDEPTVLFIFDKKEKFSLSSIKVVSDAEAKTNKTPHAYWNLTARNGSKPVVSFPYGFPVPGMETAKAAPESLEPGEKYRLIVQTSNKKLAQLVFEAP